MNHKHRSVTIYLPDGSQLHYTTCPAAVDTEVQLAHAIECEANRVNVVLKDTDGSLDGYAYVGMPYALNMF